MWGRMRAWSRLSVDLPTNFLCVEQHCCRTNSTAFMLRLFRKRWPELRKKERVKLILAREEVAETHCPPYILRGRAILHNDSQSGGMLRRSVKF